MNAIVCLSHIYLSFKYISNIWCSMHLLHPRTQLSKQYIFLVTIFCYSTFFIICEGIWLGTHHRKTNETQHDVYYKIYISEDAFKASRLLRDFDFEICENACGPIEIIPVAEFVDHALLIITTAILLLRNTDLSHS